MKKILNFIKNAFVVVVTCIAVAMMMPAMGWCVNGSNMNYVYTAEDKMGFAALGIAVLVILLVFAVIFFSINHRTKREKMHLDLLMEMVKMGFVPTSEQVAEKKVTDARIALDEKFNSSVWEELYKPCLACGTCTFVCPTCQCYDIKDFNTGNGVVRFRCCGRDSKCAHEHKTRKQQSNRLCQLEIFHLHLFLLPRFVCCCVVTHLAETTRPPYSACPPSVYPCTCMHIYKERNSGNEDEWLTYKNQRLHTGHGYGITP